MDEERRLKVLIFSECKTARWDKLKEINFLVKKTPAYATMHCF